MLTVTTWWWGEKYGREYVERVAAGVKRHLKQPHRFVCVTDHPEKLEASGIAAWPVPDRDRALLAVKGCYARLRTFDPTWQGVHAIGRDDRLAWIDLDAVVTGPLDPLFDRDEDFVILQGANAANPCPYNGSLMMLRGGAYPEVWSEFNLADAARLPFYEFPDDQGWLAAKVPNAAAWNVGHESGVYAFEKPGWPTSKRNALPDGARLVCFPGWRDPSTFTHLDWVGEHWRA